jgi:hypothetical protein
LRICLYKFVGLVLVLASAHAFDQENASNPLATVNNTDLRYQYFDLDGSDRSDYDADGAYMATPELKLMYDSISGTLM